MRRFVIFPLCVLVAWAQQPQAAVPGAFVPSKGNAAATYAAGWTALAPASSATDLSVLSGNATNTVIVTRAFLQCTQTTSGTFTVQFLIRTAADTGGTSTTVTGYAFDQNNTNMTAVSSVKTYTANPTINDSAARLIDSQLITAVATSATSPNDFALWQPRIGQSVILRGTAQQLAINLNATTVTGASCNGSFQWMESAGY
jgi:hypothetical protein